MAAPKIAKTGYNELTVYDRTFIETFQAIVASGNYAPGPLIMDLTRDATQAIMAELGFTMPVPGVEVDPRPVIFKIWKDK